MHGWLAHNDTLGWTVEGVDIDPATRTRNVEYAWAADQLRQRHGIALLDAAAGYVPTWHMMPSIARRMGYIVEALDLNPASLDMPAEPGIHRVLGDMLQLPYENASFDMVLCISTLEHLTINEVERAAAELCRVARHKVIITADDAPWLPSLFEPYLDIGEAVPLGGQHLSPPVYALAGTKR